MMRKHVKWVWILAIIMGLCLLGQAVWAGGYPSKKIQIIVPYGAGGGTDTLTRIVTSYLEKELGQTMVVINRAGAKGEIGMAEAQKARPDGYHLGIISYPSNVIMAGYKKTRYDIAKMVELASFTADPTSLSVKKDSPFKTLEDLIAFAKKNPKKLTVAVSGEAHVYSVMQFEQEAGIEVTTVMHKSGSTAMNAMLGGHVDAAFISLQWCLAAQPQGCPIFAVASDVRTSNAPDIPIFKEFGYDVECVMARLLIAPAGTPADVLQKLTEACDKVGQSAELKEKVNKAGAIFKYRSGKAMTDYFKRSNQKILKLVGENKDAFLRGA